MSMIGHFISLSKEQANELRTNPSAIADFVFSEDIQGSDSHLDVDKAWHGVHFLLTGSGWGGEKPLSWVVLGGEAIGDEVSYGPARFLRIEEVREVNAAISTIDSSVLKSRYDASSLNRAEIYPEGWEPGAADYLIVAFQDIKAFYKKAAENEQCVIQFIS